MARSRKQFAGLLALFAAFFLSAAAGWAAIDPSTVQKLVAGDRADLDYFGHSVSVDGDIAVIGAYGDDNNRGAAYIFVRSGNSWNQQAKLQASDGVAGDYFGISVSISGETVIVGSYSSSELAYVFIRSGGIWSQQAKLSPYDGGAGDFGWSVSVFGDRAVIGTRYSGSAYVFVRSGGNWNQQAKLLPIDGMDNDNFGCSVSISDNTIVIGACKDSDNGSESGSAYVFIFNGNGVWNQQAKLLPTDGAADDWFGESVSVDGDTVLIGSYRDDDNGEWSGSAYIFVRSGSIWSQQSKLTIAGGSQYDLFGDSVSVSGDIAVIGAGFENGTGAAYIFVRSDNTWSQQTRLTAPDPTVQDWFGCSIFISDNTVIIGSYGDNDNGNTSGSAYVYTSTSTPSSDVAVTVTGPSGGGIYHPGDQVTINWETENADPADTMVLSMKRDAVSTMPAPDERSWFRFTENTSNDGSETVTIPDSVVAASDWRFYVRHAASGKYAASGLVEVAEPANAAKLYMEKSGDGLGTVTTTRPPGRRSPSSCGIGCVSQTSRVSAGETVFLTAEAGTNSVFSGWRGCDSVNGNQCTITVNDYEEVAAQFSAAENATVPLIVIFSPWPYEQGSVVSDPPGISCSDNSGTCRAKFVPGQTITLTPTAAQGASFEGWKNTYNSTLCSSMSGDACVVTIPAEGYLRFHPDFTSDPQQNFLHLSIDGSGEGSIAAESNSGSITCTKDDSTTGKCSKVFPEDEQITVTAVPAAGSGFSHWKGWAGSDCFGSTEPTCEFSMTMPHTLTAVFEKAEANLAVDVRSNVGLLNYGAVWYYIDVVNKGNISSGEAVVDIQASLIGNGGEEVFRRCDDQYNANKGTCEKTSDDEFKVTVNRGEQIRIIVSRYYGTDVNTAILGANVIYTADVDSNDNEGKVELHRDPATLSLRTDVRLQDSSNKYPPVINRQHDTLVFTHGWQDRDPDGCEGRQEQDMLKCFSKQLWSGMDGEKGQTGGLAEKEFDATAPNALEGDINTLQYIWAGAFTQTGMTAAGYIRGRRHVFDAGRRLGEMLIEYLGSDYSGKVHFVGHSLGTAVNAYAVRYFLNHNTAAIVQMTILDHPNRVSKIGLLDDMSNDEAKQWGFDQNFFAGVLPELDKPDEKDRLYVDNYFAAKTTKKDSRDTKIRSAGVGTAISGKNVYNHLKDSGLYDPNDVGQYLFFDEGLFTPLASPFLYHFNDHSGVHQWYRWTMWPDRTEYLRGNQFVCSNGVWTKPLLLKLLDDSLNPCNTGFAHSILREGWVPEDFPARNGYETKPSPAAEYDMVGGGATQRCSIQVTPLNTLNISCSALESSSSPEQPAAARSVAAAAAIDTASDYAKMTIKLEKDISALSFAYQFADVEPQENVHLLIDGVIVWSMYADAQTGWTQSGKIPVAVKKGEHSLLLAFNKTGDSSSFAVQNMQFFEDPNSGSSLAPILMLLLNKH